MGTFSGQIHQFAEKVQQRADMAMRKLVIDITQQVKLKTPVDTGLLRASWTCSLNAPPTSFNGDASVNASVKFGDTWYIATDKPYAEMLEYGLYPNPPKQPTGKTVNGFSKQAPQGMVRITLKQAQAIVKGWKF